MATPPSGVNTWLTLNNRPLLFGPDEQNFDIQVGERKNAIFRVTKHAPEGLTIIVEDVELETERWGYWTWFPKDYAGLYEVRIQVPEQEGYRTRVRVFAEKIEQANYDVMQKELIAIAHDLFFQLRSLVTERVALAQNAEEASALNDYHKVRKLMDDFASILSAIRHDPHRVLKQQELQTGWQHLRTVDNNCQPVGHDMIRLSRRASPIATTWRTSHPTLSYDMYENRLVKHFLSQLLPVKLESIRQRAESEVLLRRPVLLHKQKMGYNDALDEEKDIQALEQVVLWCEAMKQRCWHWRNEAFLKEVRSEVASSKATQLLLKHPSYRCFYQLYLNFQQQFQLSFDTQSYVTEIGLRKTSELYEIWSVFKLTEIVVRQLKEAGYRIIAGDLADQIDKNYFQFRVRKDRSNLILERANQRVEIKFEPVYPNTASTRPQTIVSVIGNNRPQTPDMSIEVYQAGDSKPKVLVFDAKYSWERQKDGTYRPAHKSLEKMAFYRQSIRYKTSSKSARRRGDNEIEIVAISYALYPGHYVEGGDAVGALALYPNMPAKIYQETWDEVNSILSDTSVI
ncbi:DUF2357 domain-containing protein [Tengunoibacter tsumagoiensis]|uniref:DUF2357 domain-containing protein n=1 Tax=Tengunoibacter tsumagoiensis TaxID=2014871 RepID=A0A402A638_9CHLR|nr:DUF2357 domain-containing protein [Tengunoibacter tsumagoiensis]GCE14590.1 hypothetical protein KTT_44490 [Tengunoibacter tsumagoiensis]